MVNDFDAALDSIFTEREARSANARREVARKTEAVAAFAKAWNELRTNIVMPVFIDAVDALGRRGVTASIGELGHGVGFYIHVNAARAGRGRERDGQPYFTIMVDATTQLVRFVRNRAGVGNGEDIGDLPLEEIDANTIRARLLTLLRELFSDR